jgi:hypothetical protein
MLMALAVSAWRLRQAARRALIAEDFTRARDLAARAEQISASPNGRALLGLANWLAME